MTLIGIEMKPRTVIDILHDSDFDFYLTGSRFFNHSKPDSDWDFFCENKPEIQIFLSSLGFVPLSSFEKASEKIPLSSFDAGYSDSNVAFVMRYVETNLQIDVQLQKDLNKKIRAQNRIKKCVNFRCITDKNIRKLLWNLAYQD